ncbi:DUF432 domain-containing protein [Archaeoglobus veneficus]|uniref:DUF432 domain-containing protein n=1 Tax=Archaeoglobus veneficus (strain DSM 11195 / SNP6) TaxID=693661 RepID=F2KTC0_ARCVS|nr:DUF432 domain-containing protein [Archaeoglobus veneficus]AEA47150.1 protein of unknown function DUF432 [Archaeoglobus veneficus SNP6]
MIYGSHEYGFSYSGDDLTVECGEVYRRICRGDHVEKILSGGKKFIINPVEPVNLPREVTHYLCIDFKKPVLIESGASITVFVKFPVEICVFVNGKGVSPIDVFSLVTPKYTLYGNPKSGVICRWYESDVYTEVPETDPLREGIISLRIHNSSDDWVEVTKAVFDSYAMKIYYGDIVSMVAEMKVIGKHVAETTFIDRPLREGMKKSIELYVARKLLIERKSFLMEWGV